MSVGYDAVTGTIIKLRKALDDDPRQPRYIATLPKRGYRLLPEVVQALEPTPVEAAAVPPASTPSRTRSLPARAPRIPWTRMATIGLPLALVLAFAVGYVDLYGLGNHDAAIAEARRTLELNPNYADAYARLSSAYFFAGEFDETFDLDQEAIRLNPASSFLYYVHLGRRDYLEGRYQEALDIFLTAAAKDYNYLPTHVWLAATYAKLGDLDSATWSADQVRTLDPGFSAEEWVRRWPFKKPEHRARLMVGLKAAGLQ